MWCGKRCAKVHLVPKEHKYGYTCGPRHGAFLSALSITTQTTQLYLYPHMLGVHLPGHRQVWRTQRHRHGCRALVPLPPVLGRWPRPCTLSSPRKCGILRDIQRFLPLYVDYLCTHDVPRTFLGWCGRYGIFIPSTTSHNLSLLVVLVLYSGVVTPLCDQECIQSRPRTCVLVLGAHITYVRANT